MAYNYPGAAHLLRDDEMILVPKNFLFDGMTLPLSIYLRIKDDTYVIISKQNEKAQISNMKGFNHENFKVYVRCNEKHLLVSFISRLTNATIELPDLGIERKTAFVQGLLEDTFLHLSKTNFADLKRVKDVGDLLVKLSSQVPSIDAAMRLLQSQDEKTSRHAMATCLISVLIAEEAGMLTNLNRDKLVAGALLHNMGIQHIPESILSKPRECWSADELANYEQHPIKGAEMMKHVEGMSVEVLLIIAEHHENAIGTGFPKKIRDIRMNPLSKIVALAVALVELILPDEGKAYSADEAVQYIDKVLGQPFNKQYFSNLKNIVNANLMLEKIKKAS